MADLLPQYERKDPQSGINGRVPAADDRSSTPNLDIETFHILDDGHWMNRLAGGEVFPEVYEMKSDAVIAGRELARKRKVEHLIRTEDGTISRRDDYGGDPAPSSEWG